MKSKLPTSVELNLSLWFALLSPLIGACVGVLGLFVLCR